MPRNGIKCQRGVFMIGGIAAFLTALPASLGITSLMKKISLKFMRYDRNRAFTVVPIYGGEDTEFILRGVLSRAKWLDGTGHKIWILNCGMDETSERICIKFSEQYTGVDIILPEQLKKHLETVCRKEN